MDTGKPRKTCVEVASRRTFRTLPSRQQSGMSDYTDVTDVTPLFNVYMYINIQSYTTHSCTIKYYLDTVLALNVGHHLAINQEHKNVYRNSVYIRLEIACFCIKNVYKVYKGIV